MSGNEYIAIYWVDSATDEIIFVDAITVKNFKKMSGRSPHKDGEFYHDVVIKIEEEQNDKNSKIEAKSNLL